MKYLSLFFKWAGIILRIIPHLEKLYDQITVSIEVIKEEANNTGSSNATKKANVQERLQTKIGRQPKKLSGVIDGTVSVLKGLNVL